MERAPSRSAGDQTLRRLPEQRLLRKKRAGKNAKRSSSRYDYVKVRVWVEEHHYVLSRYLVCRALVGTKIDPKDAVKISLELKKTLVDLGHLDITQSQFESYLVKMMHMFNYGELYMARYREMSLFYHRQVPLIILLGGTKCVGKSTLAAKLADRLNLPSVLQTDVVYDLIKSMGIGKQNPCWEQTHTSPDELIHNFSRECESVRLAVDSDIQKCLTEGRALILEGVHIDPSLYTTITEGLNKSGGVVMPFVLTLTQADHHLFVQCSQKTCSDTHFSNLRIIQNYLGSTLAAPESGIVVEMNVHSFEETLDALHTAVLERIQS